MQDSDTAIRRAEVYKQYYEDPIYREPYDMVREALVEAWQKTAAGDTATRERIYLMLGLLKKVDEVVGRTIASGVLDKRNLDKATQHRKQDFLGLTD